MITHIHDTDADAARALIERILHEASRHSHDQKFNIALSGGSTPALMFRLWGADYRRQTPWERLRFFWVDERCVPPTDRESNYGMTHENLLAGVCMPPENILRIKGENDPEEEARRYEAQVRSLLPEEEGFPRFDMVILGAGEDGHTSSIFPGQEHLLTTRRVYAVASHPKTGQRRIALTGHPIIRAGRLIFLLTGRAKAPVLADIVDTTDAGPAAYVAARALHTVEIFADAAAAGRA